MENFALYRLPDEKEYTEIVHCHGAVERFSDITSIGDREGYVFAPFSAAPDMPILLLHKDIVTVRHVEETATLPFKMERSDIDRERRDYSASFKKFHAKLSDGTFEKLVMARRSIVRIDSDIDAGYLFFRACNLYPKLFIALVSAEGIGTWLTATPEILLKGKGHSYWTMALAGTRKADCPAGNASFKGKHVGNYENCTGLYRSFPSYEASSGTSDSMRIWSEQTRREQEYVSDFIGEKLKKYSCSIKSIGPYTSQSADLLHIRTDFSFSVDDFGQIPALLSDLHPTPAVCGVPKALSAEFILSNENAPRQYYSGFTGIIGKEETALFVTLRCMKIERTEGHLYAGGGLMADSDENREWEETEAKLQTMLRLFAK